MAEEQVEEQGYYELAEYTRRTQEFSSQFQYVRNMWSSLSIYMMFPHPPNTFHFYLCRTTYTEYLRHIYLFYSALAMYLGQYRKGKALELGSYLLICLRRMDSVYRSSMIYFVPKFVAGSNRIYSPKDKEREEINHLLFAHEMVESTFENVSRLCSDFYGRELEGQYAEWTDTTFDKLTGASHLRFQSYLFQSDEYSCDV